MKCSAVKRSRAFCDEVKWSSSKNGGSEILTVGKAMTTAYGHGTAHNQKPQQQETLYYRWNSLPSSWWFLVPPHTHTLTHLIQLFTVWLLYTKKALGLHRIPLGSVLLFSLSPAAIMHAFEWEKQSISPLMNRSLCSFCTSNSQYSYRWRMAGAMLSAMSCAALRCWSMWSRA